MAVRDFEILVRQAFEGACDELQEILLDAALKQQDTGNHKAMFDMWESAWLDLENAGVIADKIYDSYAPVVSYSELGHAVSNVFAERASDVQKSATKGLLGAFHTAAKTKKKKTSSSAPKPKQKRTMKMKPTLPDSASKAPASPDPMAQQLDAMHTRAVEDLIRKEEQNKSAASKMKLRLSQLDPFARIKKTYGEKICGLVVCVLAEASIAAAFENRGHKFVVSRFSEQLKSLVDSAVKSDLYMVEERMKGISKEIKAFGIKKSCLIALPLYMAEEQRELFYTLMQEAGNRKAYMGEEGIISLKKYKEFLAGQKPERRRIALKKVRGEMPLNWHLATPYNLVKPNECERGPLDDEESLIESWHILPSYFLKNLG